jgi:hypothetical protein
MRLNLVILVAAFFSAGAARAKSAEEAKTFVYQLNFEETHLVEATRIENDSEGSQYPRAPDGVRLIPKSKQVSKSYSCKLTVEVRSPSYSKPTSGSGNDSYYLQWEWKFEPTQDYSLSTDCKDEVFGSGLFSRRMTFGKKSTRQKANYADTPWGPFLTADTCIGEAADNRGGFSNIGPANVNCPVDPASTGTLSYQFSQPLYGTLLGHLREPGGSGQDVFTDVYVDFNGGVIDAHKDGVIASGTYKLLK